MICITDLKHIFFHKLQIYYKSSIKERAKSKNNSLTLSMSIYLANLFEPGGGGSYMTPPLIPPLYDLEL
jgi:hypothetical protein